MIGGLLLIILLLSSCGEDRVLASGAAPTEIAFLSQNVVLDASSQAWLMSVSSDGSTITVIWQRALPLDVSMPVSQIKFWSENYLVDTNNRGWWLNRDPNSGPLGWHTAGNLP